MAGSDMAALSDQPSCQFKASVPSSDHLGNPAPPFPATRIVMFKDANDRNFWRFAIPNCLIDIKLIRDLD
jgi:hypothetical protein